LYGKKLKIYLIYSKQTITSKAMMTSAIPTMKQNLWKLYLKTIVSLNDLVVMSESDIAPTVTLDELSILYDNFAALDRDDGRCCFLCCEYCYSLYIEDGKVTVDDLVTYNLGAIMNDSELANHFFSSFYKHNG